jgi:hypothetical protein
MTDIEKRWTAAATRQLIGRRIILVRYMTQEEADDVGWISRPVVLVLDDGNLIYPAADDEGNDGGALYTNNEQNPVLPVI